MDSVDTAGVGIEVRRAADRYRGGDQDAGIESLHSFSFGPHYDPANLRFGPLIALNEERLAPGAGFGEHPHSHTEIVTWVVEGELSHLDSSGHETVVRPGDVQRLSAGGGVRHTERNAGPKPLVFVQMWLAPSVAGGPPGYEVVRGIADATPYALPAAGSLLHVRRLGPGRRSELPVAPLVHLHVVRGAVRLPDGRELAAGDTVRAVAAGAVEVTGVSKAPAELLAWELPGR